MPGPGVKDFVPQAQQRRGEEMSSKTIRRSDGRVTKRNTTRGLARGQGKPRADSADRILEAYVSHERKKDTTPQDHACTAAAMEAYQTTIILAPAPSHRPLAILVTSIGDSSALLLLKEAIQGLRSPQVGELLCVDRRITIPERIQVIKRIGACTALLRLVRWLHIVTLWEELSRKTTGDCFDRFVVLTPTSVAQHTTRTGNPLYLARKEVAQGLSDSNGSQSGSSQDGETHKNTRLRRLGQRLGLVVRTWGQGILLILGQEFSEGR
ncbi:hypothetical protein LTR17_026393 [Elasticomyces elasticus]|nr:hypothetical protein LTR17_026393 [Elasticomyces elasticus]